MQFAKIGPAFAAGGTFFGEKNAPQLGTSPRSFPKEKLVYLTADADEVLESFEPEKVYVIGALEKRFGVFLGVLNTFFEVKAKQRALLL